MENKSNIDSKFSKIYLSKRVSKIYPKDCLLKIKNKKNWPSYLLQYKGQKRYLSTIYKDKEQKLQNNRKGSNQYQQKLQARVETYLTSDHSSILITNDGTFA